MRLIHTFTNEHDAKVFAAFLSKEKIEYQLDVKPNTDWGSSEYGNVVCKLWIIDEDKLNRAREWLDFFLENPKDPSFTSLKQIPLQYDTASESKQTKDIENFKNSMQVRTPPQEQGRLTYFILLICLVIFVLQVLTSPKFEPYPSSLPPGPLFSSQVQKVMLYDYPAAYQLLDKIVRIYGRNALLNPEELPQEGKYLLQQFYRTPYWHGIYGKFVNAFRKKPAPLPPEGPMFEKIKQGEFWRLFTPVFLHQDILHLLFNMIWLVMLGKQIEFRIGKWRYFLFILLAGFFSNTAQYLISGPEFIGFSGVLCAMITFVWFRQKRAPWEGYQLLPVTMGFITAFILAMSAIQVVSFFFDIFGDSVNIGSNIANTAHLAGAFIGTILAYTSIFSRQTGG